MIRTTFNRIREVKDQLPHGSIAKIATELEIPEDSVRDFFSGNGSIESGYHIEPGPDGGVVSFENTAILEKALRIIWLEQNAI